MVEKRKLMRKITLVLLTTVSVLFVATVMLIGMIVDTLIPTL